ncbi:MAG: hypothetical protein PVJ09_03520 [Candidatus Woesebacteria bacterium]
MQNLTRIAILLIVSSSGLWYSYQIIFKKVKPVLSTWLIMLVGASLSLFTYLSASNWNLKSNILNMADVVNLLIITMATLAVSRNKLMIRPFEKWYFLGMVIISLFWIFSKDPFISNLLIQGLIWVGYFPTIHKLITEKSNTESFLTWGGVLLAGLLALIPASDNLLSLIYAGRTVIMVSIILSLMLQYKATNVKQITDYK